MENAGRVVHEMEMLRWICRGREALDKTEYNERV